MIMIVISAAMLGKLAVSECVRIVASRLVSKRVRNFTGGRGAGGVWDLKGWRDSAAWILTSPSGGELLETRCEPGPSVEAVLSLSALQVTPTARGPVSLDLGLEVQGGAKKRPKLKLQRISKKLHCTSPLPIAEN